MLPDIQEIEKKALKLSSHERALLAEHLISTLEDKEDAEAERLWIEEAECRYREYKEGKVKAKSPGQVFKEAFSKLAWCMPHFFQKQSKKCLGQHFTGGRSRN